MCEFPIFYIFLSIFTYDIPVTTFKHPLVSNQMPAFYLSILLGLFVISYSWIGPPVQADKKSICHRTRRARIISRPPLESSRRGEFRSFRYIFCDHFLTFYFLKQVKTWLQQKYTRKIWILPVKYSM